MRMPAWRSASPAKRKTRRFQKQASTCSQKRQTSPKLATSSRGTPSDVAPSGWSAALPAVSPCAWIAALRQCMS